MLDNLRSLYGIIEYERCLEVDIRRDGFFAPRLSSGLCAPLYSSLLVMFTGATLPKPKSQRQRDAVKKMIDDAQKRAETIKKETILEAKEEAYKIKSESEKDLRDRRNELQRSERRLAQREETLDKKMDGIEQREAQLNEKFKEAEKIEAAAKEDP